MSKVRKKSNSWAAKQNKDQYVKQARQKGWRARSIFKLDQIANQYRLIQPHSRVLDLGCAPGSWCQFVASAVAADNQVLGIDLLAMQAIDKISFIQGDFSTPSTRAQILIFFKDHRADLVLSDMTPNITGIKIKDQARTEQMQNHILNLCVDVLKPGGRLLTKVFEGESMNAIKAGFAAHFKQILMIKPDASRAQSKEVYILAKGFIR